MARQTKNSSRAFLILFVASSSKVLVTTSASTLKIEIPLVSSSSKGFQVDLVPVGRKGSQLGSCLQNDLWFRSHNKKLSLVTGVLSFKALRLAVGSPMAMMWVGRCRSG